MNLLMEQEMPSELRVKPLWQSHVYDPTLLMHRWKHPSVCILHSSTSTTQNDIYSEETVIKMLTELNIK